jgi:hypothetical protein
VGLSSSGEQRTGSVFFFVVGDLGLALLVAGIVDGVEVERSTNDGVRGAVSIGLGDAEL